jgi:hypothetical protein
LCTFEVWFFQFHGDRSDAIFILFLSVMAGLIRHLPNTSTNDHSTYWVGLSLFVYCPILIVWDLFDLANQRLISVSYPLHNVASPNPIANKTIANTVISKTTLCKRINRNSCYIKKALPNFKSKSAFNKLFKSIMPILTFYQGVK